MLLLIQSTAAEFGTSASTKRTIMNAAIFLLFLPFHFSLLLIFLYYFQFFVTSSSILINIVQKGLETSMSQHLWRTFSWAISNSIKKIPVLSSPLWVEYNLPATGHLMGTGFLAAKSKTNDKQSIQWIEINWPDRTLTQKAVIFQFFPIWESHPRANRNKIILNHS